MHARNRHRVIGICEVEFKADPPRHHITIFMVSLLTGSISAICENSLSGYPSSSCA